MSERRRIAVLGAGRVGGLIARDLADDPTLSVLSLDGSDEALGRLDGVPLDRKRIDVTDRASLDRALKACDVVVGAVPGRLGRVTLESVIDIGKPIVDISFSPEDPLQLAGRAREKGVPVVVDCGVSPGLSNWLVGRAADEVDEIEDCKILIGGLPVTRVWPFEYGVVSSPVDVIEQYLRPSRLKRDGRVETVEALSEVELVDIDGVGTLEAFNTDGLRTLLTTVPARNLREKTMRYPGHADRMRMLRETGFFSDEPVDVDGVLVRPRALTERLLFDAWRLGPGEEELTVLHVHVVGRRDDALIERRWELLDRTDTAGAATSLARTTGFPCAIVARMLADGTWTEPGVHPPEILGTSPELTGRMLSELSRRGVQISRHKGLVSAR